LAYRSGEEGEAEEQRREEVVEGERETRGGREGAGTVRESEEGRGTDKGERDKGELFVGL